MKLYEITADHMALQKLADEDIEGELTEALADTFEGLKGDFDSKAISLVTVVQNIGADSASVKLEIERLTRRKKTIDGKQEWLKEYLRSNMEASGISKIECPLFTITLGKGRDVVLIEDVEIIPTDYLKIETTYTPMKKEILADLKQGVSIKGSSMMKSKSSLRIK